MDNKYLGSSFDSWLIEEEIYEACIKESNRKLTILIGEKYEKLGIN